MRVSAWGWKQVHKLERLGCSLDRRVCVARRFAHAQTAVKIEEGVKQIAAAEKTQKMSRMMWCIVGLIVAIVLLLIIVIIRHA